MIVGIDYGDSKTGISLSESMIIASPYLTIYERNLKKLCIKIGEIINKKNVSLAVVGYPLDENGKKNKRCEVVDRFVCALSDFTNVKIIRHDERFSTKMANQNMRECGLKSKRIAKKEDAVAAAIILQSYLNLFVNSFK